MDNNLERSVRFLEDAVLTPTKGLFKLSNVEQSEPPNFSDLSIYLVQQEFQPTRPPDDNLYSDTFKSLVDGDKTLTGSVIQTGSPWTNTTNNLYVEFADILQSSTGGLDMLDVAADFGRCCSDVLTVVQTLKSKVTVNQISEEKWLENERNNWRLLYVLYQDRLRLQGGDQDGMHTYVGQSERKCVEILFKREHLIRETQLVIDWLERNALERDDPILHHSDWTYGWEHTLHQLLAPDSIAIGSNTDIIKNIQPDAPQFEKLSLHHFDVANDKKLCQRIFMEIRCGKLEKAQELCYNSGHPWRAAMLEGWKLYHNPNVHDGDTNYSDAMIEDEDNNYRDVEGNSNRDLWKLSALEYCHQINLNIHEKAAIASLSGYLEAILPVCKTWEDYLWAYLRTMVDIRVESEIRDTIVRNYMSLPEEYWEQKLSLNDIFTILEVTRNSMFSAEAKEIDRIIQKHIILDEIPKLIELLSQWTEESSISTQSLRFFAHLVLFFDSFGNTGDRRISERVIEAYIAKLSDANETHLVAMYVSYLGKRKLILIYAKHLEKIMPSDQRKEALRYAEEFDLDVFAITKVIVESISNRPSIDECQGNLQKKLTATDELKISALDWLTFHDEQRAEALVQTNALIFKFLILGKLDAAQLAINKIPHDSVSKIQSEGEVSEEIQQVIKEYLSYRAYIDAQEAFSDWFKQHQAKPTAPVSLPPNAQFTEQVAHKHRVSQYTADLERWKLTTSHSAKTAKTLLYNVLLFPHGWLVGGDDADYLRSVSIPEMVLLLYSVLSESGHHEEAVQLADLIAAEKHGIYKVYSKDKLGDILEKMCESSVALLHSKRDPWGNPSTA